MPILPQGFSSSFGGTGVGRLPSSYMSEGVLGRRMEDLPRQAGLASSYLTEVERFRPRGIGDQADEMALGAGQRLQQGMGLEEKIAARERIRRSLGSALGEVAGGGAAGSSFTAQAGGGALPGYANALMELEARDAAAKREGAGTIMGSLSSRLTGPDRMGEAYGRLLGSQQAGYGGYMPAVTRGRGSLGMGMI